VFAFDLHITGKIAEPGEFIAEEIEDNADDDEQDAGEDNVFGEGLQVELRFTI
jgi:hypothetical protein